MDACGDADGESKTWRGTWDSGHNTSTRDAHVALIEYVVNATSTRAEQESWRASREMRHDARDMHVTQTGSERHDVMGLVVA